MKTAASYSHCKGAKRIFCGEEREVVLAKRGIEKGGSPKPCQSATGRTKDGQTTKSPINLSAIGLFKIFAANFCGKQASLLQHPLPGRHVANGGRAVHHHTQDRFGKPDNVVRRLVGAAVDTGRLFCVLNIPVLHLVLLNMWINIGCGVDKTKALSILLPRYSLKSTP